MQHLERVNAATIQAAGPAVAPSSIETLRVIASRSPRVTPPLPNNENGNALSLSLHSHASMGLSYRALITEHPLFASADTALRSAAGALRNGCCSSERNFSFAKRADNKRKKRPRRTFGESDCVQQGNRSVA